MKSYIDVDFDWRELLEKIHEFAINETGSQSSADNIRGDIAEWLIDNDHIDTEVES